MAKYLIETETFNMQVEADDTDHAFNILQGVIEHAQSLASTPPIGIPIYLPDRLRALGVTHLILNFNDSTTYKIRQL